MNGCAQNFKTHQLHPKHDRADPKRQHRQKINTPGSVTHNTRFCPSCQSKYEDIGGFVLFNNVHHQKLFKDPWEPSSTVLLTSLHSSDSFTYCTHSDFSAFSFSQLRSELSFSSIKHKRLTQSLELCVIL